MSAHRKTTRRPDRDGPTRNQREIDIDVPGVIARTYGDDQQTIHLLLDNGRKMFRSEVDHNIYANGWIEVANQQKPGSELSRTLGFNASSVQGVIRLRYQFITGIYVDVDFGHPDFIEILQRIALMMLEEAERFENIRPR